LSTKPDTKARITREHIAAQARAARAQRRQPVRIDDTAASGMRIRGLTDIHQVRTA
jgi:hypothetical protein